MSGRLALIGGEEFADGFEDVNASLLADAGEAPQVVFLPTCAAEDGPEVVDYWCRMAQQRLGVPGASVEALPVVDADSANDPRYAQRVAEADLVYLGGGHPHVGMRILAGTRVLAGIEAARARGALIAGASAGAMMLCARSFVITREFAGRVQRATEEGRLSGWSPPLPPPLDCLGWVPHSLCLPHFNRVFFKKWLEWGLVPEGFTAIGVDEQTALVNTNGTWEARGHGAVTLLRNDREPERYVAGQRLTL